MRRTEVGNEHKWAMWFADMSYINMEAFDGMKKRVL